MLFSWQLHLCLCSVAVGMIRLVSVLLGITSSSYQIYGWHGSQYVCHSVEVCTGRFCLCLLGNIPDIWDVSALLSAVDMTAVYEN